MELSSLKYTNNMINSESIYAVFFCNINIFCLFLEGVGLGWFRNYVIKLFHCKYLISSCFLCIFWQWVITDIACMHYSMISVPFYNTVDIRACDRIITQSKIIFPFIHNSNYHTLNHRLCTVCRSFVLHMPILYVTGEWYFVLNSYNKKETKFISANKNNNKNLLGNGGAHAHIVWTAKRHHL